LLISILAFLVAMAVTACTSEEDLVRTLQTEDDPVARQEAAADLARRHSLTATQELAAAGPDDVVAKAGVASLVDEYVAFVAATIQEAAEKGEELTDKPTLALEETIACLACIDDPKAAEALATVASSSVQAVPDTQDLRRRCLDALAAMGSKASVAALVGLASDTRSAPARAVELRDAARDALEAMGAPAVGALVGVLSDQAWAVDSLVAIGAPAVPELAQGLSGDEATARYDCLKVLLRLYSAGDETATQTLLDPEMVPLLIEARSEAPYETALQDQVVRALTAIGEQAVEPLMALAEETEWAYEALIAIDAGAVPALVSELGKQAWIEQALADIGEAAIQPVRDLIGGDDELARHRAIGVLLRLYESYETAVEPVLLSADMVPWLLADLTNEAYADEYASVTLADFDHQTMGQLALADIGQPAVDPLLASDYEWKWWLLADIGADAVPALMSVMTGDVREDALGAAMALTWMKEYSPAAVAELTLDMEEEDLEAIATNYLYYIALGEPGSEEVIGRALKAYGKKQMALDCLNCGNEVLDKAARSWAADHGYRVYTSSEPEMALQWGGAD
jgi:hypothetical protein